MEATIHFLSGFGLFFVGLIIGGNIGYFRGWFRGAKIGYQEGAKEMEKTLFDELHKLRKEGKI